MVLERIEQQMNGAEDTTIDLFKDISSKKSVFTDGILMDIDIFWWKGYIQLSPEDLDKEESEIPEVFRLGRKRMLKHEAFKNFQLIESRARTAIERYSYPFMISTVRFVPFEVLSTLLTELNVHKRSFYIFVEEFVFNYEDNIEKFLIWCDQNKQYRELREKFEGRYPSVFDIRSKFSLSWTLFNMSMPSEIQAQVTNEIEMDKIQEAWQSSQQSMNEKLDKWIDVVGMQMRKEIINTCEAISESIKAGKLIREDTLDRTRATISRLRSMNFVADLEVDKMLDVLRASIPGNMDRDVPEIMFGFKTTLDSISEEARTLSDVSSTGEYKRKFRL